MATALHDTEPYHANVDEEAQSRQPSAILESKMASPWERRPQYISESPSYTSLATRWEAWWLLGNCYGGVSPSPVTVYLSVLLR